MLKPLTVWITTNCGKFLKQWEYQTTWPAFCKICMQVKKEQLEPNMEQQTGSKLGKEFVKTVYCHPACLAYAEYIMGKAGLNEEQAGIRLLGEISLICRWHHPYGRKQRGTKKPLDESETGELKSWLKTQHSKMKIMGSIPIPSWQIAGETMEAVTDFTFLGSKITAEGDCSHEIKKCLLLGKLWQI